MPAPTTVDLEETKNNPQPEPEPESEARRLVQWRRFAATSVRGAARALHQAGLSFTIGFILGAGCTVAVVIWLAHELKG